MGHPATVVLANNFYYRRGGAEAMLMQQEAALAGQGVRTAIMSTRHPQNQDSEWSAYFADSAPWDEPDAGSALPLSQARRIVYSKQAYENTRRLIEDTNACLLHAHNVYHHLSPSVLKAASDARIPVVMTVHDYKLLCPAYSMLSGGQICEKCRGARLHNAVLKRCMNDSLAQSTVVSIEGAIHRSTGAYADVVDRFVSPSQFVIDKFVQWGWSRDKFEYVPNCVEAAQFEKSATAGTRFLYAGRLAPEKGVSRLIDAAARAKVALDIVGTGPLLESLKTQAGSLDCDIAFHGYQSGEDLYRLMRSCRALVLPSQWYENAPVSVLEAFASAKPVIVANIGGMPEMVSDGETGLIFEFGDTESLTGCLDRMSAEPDDQVVTMGANARRVVEENFSQARQSDILMSVYRALGVCLHNPSADVQPSKAGGVPNSQVQELVS